MRANSRERLTVLESLVRGEAEAAREISRHAERLGGEPPDDGRRVQALVLDNYVVPTGSGSAEQTLLRTNCES
jgi:hypothetical protein